MRKGLLILSIILTLGCTTEPAEGEKLTKVFTVNHTPNPTNQYSSKSFPVLPHENMWFYKTEIHNISDRELKIVWFESYFKYEKRWFANNILGRPLRNNVFQRWYKSKDINKDGWLRSGGKAVCVVNWHTSETKVAPEMKWCFIAVDKHGNDYYVEEILKSIPKP